MNRQLIFLPPCSPFDHNGDLYMAKIRDYVEKWNRTQLAGYVGGGSTGESVMLAARRSAATVA